MMCTRYWLAGEVCRGLDVLEVGCGAGQGLGCLASKARLVVGGDYTERLLDLAQSHFRGSMKLVRFDAHELPFQARKFDRVLLYEAIYYLVRPERFLEECRRVLRPGGMVLICTANREWPDFNPSPFSTRYLSATELTDLFRRSGFRAELFGGFPVSRETVRDRTISLAKRTAAKLHLIPETMKGKEILKRIFLGKLIKMPREVPYEGNASAAFREAISDKTPASKFKVLYAVARLG